MTDHALEGGPGRGHRSGAHTADAALHAWAPHLPGLFEEAAAALADLGATIPPDATARAEHVVEVRAADLEGLAFVWLNELIGLAEVEHGAVGAVTVELVEPGEAVMGAWRLVGRIALHGYDQPGVRSLRHVKAATFHGLGVRREPDGWSLVIVVDL
jgi:SHS2 domain-containing protein